MLLLKEKEYNAVVQKFEGTIRLLADGEILNLNQRISNLHNDPGIDNKKNPYWYNGEVGKWEPGLSVILKKDDV